MARRKIKARVLWDVNGFVLDRRSAVKYAKQFRFPAPHPVAVIRIDDVPALVEQVARAIALARWDYLTEHNQDLVRDQARAALRSLGIVEGRGK